MASDNWCLFMNFVTSVGLFFKFVKQHEVNQHW